MSFSHAHLHQQNPVDATIQAYLTQLGNDRALAKLVNQYLAQNPHGGQDVINHLVTRNQNGYAYTRQYQDAFTRKRECDIANNEYRKKLSIPVIIVGGIIALFYWPITVGMILGAVCMYYKNKREPSLLDKISLRSEEVQQRNRVILQAPNIPAPVVPNAYPAIFAGYNNNLNSQPQPSYPVRYGSVVSNSDNASAPPVYVAVPASNRTQQLS